MGNSWRVNKPAYGEDVEYIKTKIKMYAGRLITNFHNKKCQTKKHHANVYQ